MDKEVLKTALKESPEALMEAVRAAARENSLGLSSEEKTKLVESKAPSLDVILDVLSFCLDLDLKIRREKSAVSKNWNCYFVHQWDEPEAVSEDVWLWPEEGCLGEEAKMGGRINLTVESLGSFTKETERSERKLKRKLLETGESHWFWPYLGIPEAWPDETSMIVTAEKFSKEALLGYAKLYLEHKGYEVETLTPVTEEEANSAGRRKDNENLTSLAPESGRQALEPRKMLIELLQKEPEGVGGFLTDALERGEGEFARSLLICMEAEVVTPGVSKEKLEQVSRDEAALSFSELFEITKALGLVLELEDSPF